MHITHTQSHPLKGLLVRTVVAWFALLDYVHHSFLLCVSYYILSCAVYR